MPSFPDDRLTKPERIETPTAHTHRDIHPGSHTLPHSHTQALTHTRNLAREPSFFAFLGAGAQFYCGTLLLYYVRIRTRWLLLLLLLPFVVSRKPQQQQQHDWRLLKKSIFVTSPSLSLLLSLSCCRVPVVPTGNPRYDPATATPAYQLRCVSRSPLSVTCYWLIPHTTTQRKRERREVGGRPGCNLSNVGQCGFATVSCLHSGNKQEINVDLFIPQRSSRRRCTQNANLA